MKSSPNWGDIVGKEQPRQEKKNEDKNNESWNKKE